MQRKALLSEIELSASENLRLRSVEHEQRRFALSVLNIEHGGTAIQLDIAVTGDEQRQHAADSQAARRIDQIRDSAFVGGGCDLSIRLGRRVGDRVAAAAQGRV